MYKQMISLLSFQNEPPKTAFKILYMYLGVDVKITKHSPLNKRNVNKYFLHYQLMKDQHFAPTIIL